MSFVTSEPGADRIVVEAHYPVRPSRVFRAWTDPAVVKKWFGSDPGALEHAEVDLRPGGKWRFTEHTSGATATGFEGEYLEIVTDQFLMFTWCKVTEERTTGQRESTPDSVVEIRFVADGDGTAMRIVHSRLDPESRLGFSTGWTMGLANLSRELGASARSSP